MAASNIADRRYKAGADFDLLLRSRHGIENLNVCAEGMSSDDQYRLVQTQTRDPRPSGQNRMNSSNPTGSSWSIDSASTTSFNGTDFGGAVADILKCAARIGVEDEVNMRTQHQDGTLRRSRSTQA